MASSQESELNHLALALDAVGVMVHRVEPHQWELPTPCAEWNVARVVTHLLGMNLVFAALLADQPMPARVEIASEELAAQYDTSAALLLDEFSAPGVLDREWDGPLGRASGRERLQIRMYDLLAHGWDLACAIGEPLILPDQLVEESLTFATQQLAGVDRTGRFETPRPVSDQADALDRLAAFLGRDITSSAQRR